MPHMRDHDRNATFSAVPPNHRHFFHYATTFRSLTQRQTHASGAQSTRRSSGVGESGADSRVDYMSKPPAPT